MAAIQINGRHIPVPQDNRTTLLDLLHQSLNLFGTKKGCDHGQCGACTVLLNGERVNACLLMAFQCEGQSIETIEAIDSNDSLHPLQQAFIKHDAFQCGYCTPGQICSARALVDELARDDPSLLSVTGEGTVSDDIKERMSGNLCRCGAYPNIIAAICDARSKAEQKT